ncbi:MAG TPA: BrnA antitoxin family protein [Thermoanaerobaculia bacterium]
MRKVAAEPYRDIDFSQAKRGPVVKAETGKTKISIRLDNAVIEAFRELADQAGGGNYQTLINDALATYLHQRTMLEAVRQVVREELREAVPQGARPRSKASGS